MGQQPGAKDKIPFYLWPNIVSLDAPVIALVWQTCIASIFDLSVDFCALTVLLLSVWLTYTADHLFDVWNRPEKALRSLRHQWTKRNALCLRSVWICILGLDILLAVYMLPVAQIQKGAWLLLACILYTLLNQKLTRYWFPKEICVALLFSGGVHIFLNFEQWIPSFALLTTIFLMNCLLISIKDHYVDHALGDCTIASLGSITLWMTALVGLGINVLLFPASQQLTCLTIISLLFLVWLQFKKDTIDNDTLHAVADLLLLPAPIVGILIF